MALNTPADVISYARGLWSITIWQYPDAKAIDDFNKVMDKIVTTIIQEVDEGYFGNFITSPTFDWQSETYLYDETNWIYVDKVNRVFIKWADNEKYVQAKEVNREYLERDEEWYKKNQSKTSPIYYIFDKSIFVYPSPDANTTAWLKLDASLKPADKSLASSLDEFSDELKYLIADGLLIDVFQRRLMYNEKAEAKQSFDNNFADIIFSMKERVATPQEVEMPNLEHLT